MQTKSSILPKIHFCSVGNQGTNPHKDCLC